MILWRPYMVEIVVMKAVSEGNQAHADKVRAVLDSNGVVALNFVSSPGAGKTTLLERTIRDNPDLKIAVIEGDIFTARDAARIEAAGAPSIQLNTEGTCHLTANMIEAVLPKLDLMSLHFVMIENIGNLICPAGFPLGEHKRVTLLSTPEGSDKVQKYPLAFNTADVILITKTDIRDAVGFDISVVLKDLSGINPKVEPWPLSAVTGEGLDRWYSWLRSLKRK
jgi:hydrogenase nickel incorporation protein HypB